MAQIPANIAQQVAAVAQQKLGKQPPPIPTSPKPLPPATVGPDGKPVFPEGYKVLTASEGDYLCSFAAENGFLDCEYLRQCNPHLATKAVLDKDDQVGIPEKRKKDTSDKDKSLVKAKRPSYPPATVRFLVQGTKLNDRKSKGARQLGISNYITNKAGANGNGNVDPLYAAKGADDSSSMTDDEKKTYADPDHFRIEVHDVTAGKKNLATITVNLQVLQPLYKRVEDTEKHITTIVRDTTSRPNATVPDDAPAGFKIPTDADRKLAVECQRVKDGDGNDTNYYRSKYMRLVTHAKDKVANQTLFVGDYYTEGATNDEKRYTEILEQKVRARYLPAMCTKKKCFAEAYADVGRILGEVRLAIHIMDSACSVEDVRRVAYRQVRRAYAQAGIRPHIKAIYQHPEAKNILVVGAEAGTGLAASGETNAPADAQGKKTPSTVTVKVDGKTITYKPPKGSRVSEVAKALVGLIEKEGLFTKLMKYETNKKPSAKGEEVSQSLMIFKDNEHLRYSVITSVTSDDTALSAKATPLSSTLLGDFPDNEDAQPHRTIKACCDTDWFDCIIIKKFKPTPAGAQTFGIATRHFKPFGPCIIVQSDRMSPDPDDDRYTFAHELGHVLMNVGHCTTANESEQLMIMGDLAAGDATDMTGRRRIMDAPLEIVYHNVGTSWGMYISAATLKAGFFSLFKTAAARCLMYVGGDAFGAASVRKVGPLW